MKDNGTIRVLVSSFAAPDPSDALVVTATNYPITVSEVLRLLGAVGAVPCCVLIGDQPAELSSLVYPGDKVIVILAPWTI